MNKFDTVNALIEQLGLSQEEIVKGWYESSIVIFWRSC